MRKLLIIMQYQSNHMIPLLIWYILCGIIFLIAIYLVIKAALKKTNKILAAIAIRQGAPMSQFMSIEELHSYIEENRDELGLIGPSDNTNENYITIKNRLLKYGK